MRHPLRVRRFIRTRASCARGTTVEQVEDLTVRSGRHSHLLRAMLQTVGLLLAGRTGASLSQRLAMPVSSLDHAAQVRAMPDPVVGG